MSVDGVPRTLLCGSFNWSGRASRGYENLMVIGAGDPASDGVLAAMQAEFAAIWTDGAVSLSPTEAATHHAAVLAEYRAHPTRPPAEIVGIGSGDGASHPSAEAAPDLGQAVTAAQLGGPTPVLQQSIAFSSRSPGDAVAGNGYAAVNRLRRINLRKPGGSMKSVPLTLTTLALDTITGASRGERLLVAMYGLSARVPEYGALLDAARRGARVFVLLVNGQPGDPARPTGPAGTVRAAGSRASESR